jgi:putative hydrolase of the HAD superfamily
MNIETVKGIIFDYGGTIDSNGVHWAEVIWEAYRKMHIPVSKAIFREAYIHGERTLGRNPVIQPHHTFSDMMRLKIEIQFQQLRENRHLPATRAGDPLCGDVARTCYEYAKQTVQQAIPVIDKLAAKYPLVLVSNFYGNLSAVLKDFHLDLFFTEIIESALAGIRKPDPAIFRSGVDALHLPAEEVAVIGDSYNKDIIPARSIGCKTIWLKGSGWEAYRGNETADAVIGRFEELNNVFHL